MNEGISNRFKEAVEIHRQNIQRSIQHRLEVARTKGDQNLVRQVQAEIDYYN